MVDRRGAHNNTYRKTTGETLERWLVALYKRYKPRYLHVVFAFVTVVTILLVVPISAFLCLAVLVPASKIAPVFGVIFLVSLITAPPMIFGVGLYRHRVLARWLAGSPEDPVVVWRSAALGAWKTVAIIDLGIGAFVAVPGLLAARAYVKTPAVAILEALVIAITALGSLAFWLLVIEIVWRAVASDVAGHLPPDFRSAEVGQQSMRRRLFFITLMLVLFTGMAAIDLSTLAESYAERLLLGIIATVSVAFTVSGLLVALLRHSMLSRVEALKSALSTVRAGRYDLRMVPVMGDELDEVGEAFNDMVDRLATSERETQASRARIVAVADAERRRMERDLHDGAQQYLALMGLQASTIAERAAADRELSADVEELRSTLEAAQTELRNLAHGIYPASLETEGVAAALREAAARATVPVTVASDGVARLPREVEAALYFVCLEALQNVSKYAGAGATATVQLSRADHGVEFTVSDNGVGFDVETKGHGLVNMQDRIGALGGDVTIASAPGSGTTVSGWVPLDGRSDAT